MFALDKDQLQKFAEWSATLRRKNTGAIGGQFTFSFTPTNLGTVTEITDSISGEKIDVTDYESW